MPGCRNWQSFPIGLILYEPCKLVLTAALTRLRSGKCAQRLRKGRCAEGGAQWEMHRGRCAERVRSGRCAEGAVQWEVRRGRCAVGGAQREVRSGRYPEGGALRGLHSGSCGEGGVQREVYTGCIEGRAQSEAGPLRCHLCSIRHKEAILFNVLIKYLS